MYEIFVKLLEKYGVTAYKVSKATGIAGSTFSDWKSGRSVPKQEKLQKIADRMGILYQVGNIQHGGYYMYLKKHRYIFLSDRLNRRELRADLFATYLLVACALE